MSEIEKFISKFAKEFDDFFLKLLPKKKYSEKLHDAMKYSSKVAFYWHYYLFFVLQMMHLEFE